MKNIVQHVINKFSSEPTQEFYRAKASAGLWLGEAALIERHFKKGSTVLDIGCGTGRTTIPLYQLGYEVTGLDITPKMIQTAREIAVQYGHDIPYRSGDATKLDFADGSFDNALFSNNGITQISGRKNRLRALTEVRRVLKPRGVFFFSTHVRNWEYNWHLWFWLWIKVRIFKKIGFPVAEKEFGDRFFPREGLDGKKTNQRQFIHVPLAREVIKQIKMASFTVVYTGDGFIYPGSRTADPLFYVCQKK